MLAPLPYHTSVRDYFKSQSKTWDFFAQPAMQEKEWQEFKDKLLKNSYRMSENTEPHVFQALATVKTKLGIDMDFSVYQAEQDGATNAFIAHFNNEACLVFKGPLLNILSTDELTAIIAHELSHLLLYRIDNGDYYTADRILTAIANDTRSDDSYDETDRNYQLYTEIFCDRSSLMVVENAEIAQSALIKAHTGLQQVSVSNYIEQAKEILAKEKDTKTENTTHPDNYIRVLAVNAWLNNKETADAEIALMIEKNIDLYRLDIFNQKFVAELTNYVLRLFTSAPWMQTEMVLSICKQYFPGFIAGKEEDTQSEKIWNDNMSKFTTSIKEYFAFVMLDIALADTELENTALGRAFQLAEQLQITKDFESVVKKEKKLTEKKLRELANTATSAVSALTQSVA